MVSGSFHYPFGLLFSFLSRYLFAIGLELYLGLDVSATHILARITTHNTLELFPRNLLTYSNGAITRSGSAFDQIRIRQVGIGKGPNSTFTLYYYGAFGLPYTAFDRLY